MQPQAFPGVAHSGGFLPCLFPSPIPPWLGKTRGRRKHTWTWLLLHLQRRPLGCLPAQRFLGFLLPPDVFDWGEGTWVCHCPAAGGRGGLQPGGFSWGCGRGLSRGVRGQVADVSRVGGKGWQEEAPLVIVLPTQGLWARSSLPGSVGITDPCPRSKGALLPLLSPDVRHRSSGPVGLWPEGCQVFKSHLTGSQRWGSGLCSVPGCWAGAVPWPRPLTAAPGECWGARGTGDGAVQHWGSGA